MATHLLPMYTNQQLMDSKNCAHYRLKLVLDNYWVNSQ